VTGRTFIRERVPQRRAPSRVRTRASAVSLWAWVALAPGVGAQSAEAARTALRTGAYGDAVDLYQDLVRARPDAAQLRIDLMEALVSTGAYEDAVALGRAAPDPTAVANAIGEALLRIGHLDEAQLAFQQAAGRAGPWRLTAEANLAELAFTRGQVDEAMERFDRFIDVYNAAGGNLSGPDLVAVGRAVTYLARREPNLFQDALRAFDEASRADATWAEPKVRAAALFLDRYDSPAAKAELGPILEQNPNHPGALYVMAESRLFDGSSEAGPAIDRVLEIDERHVGARVLRARRHLAGESYAEAQAEAERALAVNPVSLPALAIVAGIRMLEGHPAAFERARAQVLALNPTWADMDVTLAELSVETRRYAQGVERARAAVTLDSLSWEGWGQLGLNQLRLGHIAEGRASLERAFAGDPYNPWFKNSLDLLDTFVRYSPRRTEHFELFLFEGEADLLEHYLVPIAEEAYASLAGRYGVEPQLPVRAELFPNSADFSVRTLGEAGFGALGVSFGRVLVMDAPSARELGAYNWASVFWHELAHTFHLAASDNRVPRWFSEGLAVHEQRKARPGWGHQPSIALLQAYRDGGLKKVSELNDGFMRPDYPEQVIFSYYQGSLVFELIEDTWGFDAIRRMLEGYREGHATSELFTSVLGVDVEAFDDTFDDWFRTRFRDPLAGLAKVGDTPGPDADLETLRTFARRHPGDLITRLRLGTALYRDGKGSEAEEHFLAALRIFPEMSGADSPYWFLALIHRDRGETELAVAGLERLNALSESTYEARVLQADLLEELGRSQESVAALDEAVLIWPYDIGLHERLAELHTELGDVRATVRERAAIVALDPADRAEALYRLAVAQREAGDHAAARRSVMGALEIAPNYDAALELLLIIRGSGS
jgi:tetratricopeptide (TPR) repeat protein